MSLLNIISQRNAVIAGGRPPPVLAAVSPGTGDTFGLATIVLQGARLSDVLSVDFGGTPATSITENPDGTVSVSAPAKAAGFYDVVVNTPTGSSTLVGAYRAWSPLVANGAFRGFQSDRGTTETTARAKGGFTTLRGDPGVAGSGAFTIARDGAVPWIDDDGRFYLLFGWNSLGPFPGASLTTNQVIYSDNIDSDAPTWAELYAFDANPPQTGAGAQPDPRHTPAFASHRDADGKLWLYLAGGDQYATAHWPTGYPNDLWRFDGVIFERVLENIPGFDNRMLAMMWSQNTKLFIAGGQTDITVPGTVLNDQLRSLDDGASWTDLGNAPWPARATVIGVPLFLGEAWLVSGGEYTQTVLYDDAWSYDDTIGPNGTWTNRILNGAGLFPATLYHNVIVVDGKLVRALGNSIALGGNIATINTSADGVSFPALSGASLPSATHAASFATISSARAILTAGLHAANAHDFRVWEFAELDASRFSTWVDQGSGGLSLTQAVAGQRFTLVQNLLGDLHDVPGVQAESALSQYMRLAALDTLAAGEVTIVIARTTTSVAAGGVNPGQVIAGNDDGTAFSEGPAFNLDRIGASDASTGPWVQVARGSGYLDGHMRVFVLTKTVGGTLTFYEGTSQLGATAAVGYTPAFERWNVVGAGFGTLDFLNGIIGVVYRINIDPAALPVDAAFLQLVTDWAKKWGSISV